MYSLWSKVTNDSNKETYKTPNGAVCLCFTKARNKNDAVGVIYIQLYAYAYVKYELNWTERVKLQRSTMKKRRQCRTLGECWTSWPARPALARGGRRTAQNPMKMQIISRNPMKRRRRRGIRVQSSEPSITFSLSPTSPLLSNVRYFITLLLHSLCLFLIHTF